MADVFGELKSYLIKEKHLDPAEITLEAEFRDDLGFDSLEIVELVLDMEEEYGIEIPDDETEKIITVGDAVNLIEKKLAAKNNQPFVTTK